MTPEQFAFWISGYLTSSDEKETKIFQDISIAIKYVKNDSIDNVVCFTTIDS